MTHMEKVFDLVYQRVQRVHMSGCSPALHHNKADDSDQDRHYNQAMAALPHHIQHCNKEYGISNKICNIP